MDEEKPFDLRDRIAMEILNGVLSNDHGKNRAEDIDRFLDNEDTDWGKDTPKRVERLIRNCYRVADIVRKVRLSAFE